MGAGGRVGQSKEIEIANISKYLADEGHGHTIVGDARDVISGIAAFADRDHKIPIGTGRGE